MTPGGEYKSDWRERLLGRVPLAMVIEAFEELRSGGRVLICSGYVPEELAMHGVESGAFDFLAKPFTASRLVSKLDSILAAAQRPSGR